MEIITATSEQITLEEMAALADCNPKTIRRAVGVGSLPRHYVSSARGPQLVFQPDDVQRWLEERRGRHQGRRAHPRRPTGAPPWASLHSDLERLHSTMGENQRMITALLDRLTTQLGALSELQASTADLARRLAELQARQADLSSASEVHVERLARA